MTEYDYKIMNEMIELKEANKKLENEIECLKFGNSLKDSLMEVLENEMDKSYIHFEKLKEFFNIYDNELFVKSEKKDELMKFLKGSDKL